jgi:hypothetical protein
MSEEVLQFFYSLHTCRAGCLAPCEKRANVARVAVLVLDECEQELFSTVQTEHICNSLFVEVMRKVWIYHNLAARPCDPTDTRRNREIGASACFFSLDILHRDREDIGT